ncbi:hypothetical protein [Granulicella mallensis]|uniref:Uncharacterized protein n=1 Tax=Granulicella mallensis (strain ATCC BAA-1857 / DSM 23137 / MP5ACTX8) TaxID=682795 RepID=G8NSE0_GRAMM|nr:hypothetical protein [Granulicella mallensis]AEU37434.1 hypothetical protein AciX8_3131 [Granulicella mallensis MP5ACTX8]
MNRFLKSAFAVCLVLVVVAGSASVKAQTVLLDGLGSSGLFLQLGLGANSSSGTIHAPCVWSENTNIVAANDFSVSGNPSTPLKDAGSAWVAWTTGSGPGASCTSPAANAMIYAYLSTDSVAGNRCLYNSNLSGGSKCSIAYPLASVAPAGLILPAGTIVSGAITTANCGGTGECALPSSVLTALNLSTQLVNYAGTDIRPEDAKFAITRALTNCGSVVATGSQILGLGYQNGSAIHTAISGSTNFVNVINFALPTSFFVTPVGATPIIVAVNDSTGTGLRAFSNITSQALAHFLDGTYSFTDQASGSPNATGSAVTVYIPEPLSGNYNVMEFNVPNRIGTLGGSFATSQDVGLNQPSSQRNCTVTSPWPVPSTTLSTVLHNPLDFTVSGGGRLRTVGANIITNPSLITGTDISQELSSVVGNTSNSLGYGFWSAANFTGFSAVATTAKYYSVDGVDPLGASGTIPTTPAELANVSLATTADGQYPIWSMLRLVNVGTTQNITVAALAASAQDYSVAVHLDFVPLANMLVVRSHFTPPGQTLTASNGSGSTAYGSNRATACSATETGGDVGGVVIGLKTASLSHSPLTLSDQTYCLTTSTTGQTGH